LGTQEITRRRVLTHVRTSKRPTPADPRLVTRLAETVATTDQGNLECRSIYQLRSNTKIEAIEIHDLVPRSHEITHERFSRVVTSIHLRDGPELGV
jgi:hypothetical protein